MTYAGYRDKTKTLEINPNKETINVSTIGHEIRCAIKRIKGRDIIPTKRMTGEASVMQYMTSMAMSSLKRAENLFPGFHRQFDTRNTFIHMRELVLVMHGALVAENKHKDIDEEVILAATGKIWGREITQEEFEDLIAAAKAIEA